jgi:hypothetical protein
MRSTVGISAVHGGEDVKSLTRRIASGAECLYDIVIKHDSHTGFCR